MEKPKRQAVYRVSDLPDYYEIYEKIVKQKLGTMTDPDTKGKVTVFIGNVSFQFARSGNTKVIVSYVDKNERDAIIKELETRGVGKEWTFERDIITARDYKLALEEITEAFSKAVERIEKIAEKIGKVQEERPSKLIDYSQIINDYRKFIVKFLRRFVREQCQKAYGEEWLKKIREILPFKILNNLKNELQDKISKGKLPPDAPLTEVADISQLWLIISKLWYDVFKKCFDFAKKNDLETRHFLKHIFYKVWGIRIDEAHVYPITERDVEGFETYTRDFFQGLSEYKEDLEEFEKLVASYKISPPFLRRPSLVFEINNVEDLFELEKREDFIENRLCGKFIDQPGRKPLSWRILKENNIINFEWVENKPSPHFSICFITGKYGVGKTTYLFYWIDKCLSCEPSWFKSVVFLNPVREKWIEEEIIRELARYDPQQVLIAIDSLYREGDTNETFKNKFKFILDQIVGAGFRVIITLRDTHFEILKKDMPVDFHSEIIELKPTRKSTETILKNYARLYGLDVELRDSERAISILFEKSEGSPYYIHHLVRMLYLENRKLTDYELNNIPQGMKNLIWHTIDQELLVPNDDTIPLILVTLLNQRKSLPLSFDFIKYLCKWWLTKNSKEVILNDASTKLSLLKMYMLPRPFESSRIEKYVSRIERFQFDEIWKQTIEEGLKEPDKLAKHFKSLEQIKTILNFYETIKHEFVSYLEHYITETLKTSISYEQAHSIALLLADLGKFDANQLPNCSKIFLESIGQISWPAICLEYIKCELSLAWFISAIDLRDKGERSEAEKHLKEAIKLNENFKQALHLYVYLLQRRLPHTKQEERPSLIKEIEDVYLKLESLGPDAYTWQTHALFYKEINEYKKAEDLFEKSLAFFPDHVPTIQAYAIYCEEMGSKLWRVNKRQAESYIKKAYELYKKGKIISEKLCFSERELLNAFAGFLRKLASWKGLNYKQILEHEISESEDEKIRYELDKKVDDIFNYTISKYPDHVETINSYADFLIDVAGVWLKERYPDDLNLQKAEKLLKPFLNDNPVSQNIYAQLCQRRGQFQVADYWFDRSINNPKVKQLKNPELHIAICYHNKAKLYMDWLDKLGEKLEYGQRETMLKATLNYLKEAKKTPENVSTYHHLSEVHMSLAQYFAKYLVDNKEARIAARKYARRSVEYAKKAQWINTVLIKRLLEVGKEVMRIDPGRALYFYEAVCEIDETNTLSRYAKARCLAYLKKIGTAIDEYRKVAEIQNTLKGYRKVRCRLKEIQTKLEIRDESWGKCLESIKWCSERIMYLNSNNWRDFINYSKDLIEYGITLCFMNEKNVDRVFIKAFDVLKAHNQIFVGYGRQQVSFLQTICKKWIEKLREVKNEQFTKINDLLALAHETYEKFYRFSLLFYIYYLKRIKTSRIRRNRHAWMRAKYKLRRIYVDLINDIKRAYEFLNERFELNYPFIVLEELHRIKRKFLALGDDLLKLKYFNSAFKCYNSALKCQRKIFELHHSSENLKELIIISMKLGRFEDAANYIKDYECIAKTDDEKKQIIDLLKKCESAINIKEKLSNGLMLLITIAQELDVKPLSDVARLFYQAGNDLLRLKDEIELHFILFPLLGDCLSDKQLRFMEGRMKEKMIPKLIINSCFMKAIELDPHFLVDIDQIRFKIEKSVPKNYSYYFYIAEKLQKEAAETEYLNKITKSMSAAFFYCFYLILKNMVAKNEEKSELWGKTGGSLVKININSPIKISPKVLIRCFLQSLNYNTQNKESLGQLGRQYYYMKNFAEAKKVLERSETSHSLKTLGDISEVEGKKSEAKDYYVKASELLIQSENEMELRNIELEKIAEKLVCLGFSKDALKIYEFIKNSSQGIRKTLVEAKLQFLKMRTEPFV
jgi:tetratricopeptide (TPR) repeat protein